MRKAPPAASPEAYVAALAGWQRPLVESLRKAVLGAAPFTEAIKWGHLVYASTGPVLLIRAEETRVLFGFWRGQRLRELEPRLKPGGKYEMATLELREGDSIPSAKARALAKPLRRSTPRSATRPARDAAGLPPARPALVTLRHPPRRRTQ